MKTDDLAEALVHRFAAGAEDHRHVDIGLGPVMDAETARLCARPSAGAFDVSRWIIDRPVAQSPVQRWTGHGIALAAFGLWTTVWVPMRMVGTLLAGGWIAWVSVHGQDGYGGLLQLLPNYARAILGLVALLYAWMWVNQVSFARRDRRWLRRPTVPDDERARGYGIASEQLAQWRHAARMVLHYHGNGRVAIAELVGAPAGVEPPFALGDEEFVSLPAPSMPAATAATPSAIP